MKSSKFRIALRLGVLSRRRAQENRHLAEIHSLRRLNTALLQQQSLDEVLSLICSEAQRLTGALDAKLLILENESWLKIFQQTGNALPNMERLPLVDSSSILSILQKRAVLINDVATSPELGQSHSDLKSLLATPLVIDSEVNGTLQMGNKPGGFTQDDMRILSLFADQAAMAVANSQLHEHAKQQAVLEERQRLARELHDSVTQVLYSIILYADATRLALAAGKNGEATQNVHELRNMAHQAMADMRMLLFQLHPPALEDEGLVAALQMRLEAIESRAGLQVELRVEGENNLPIFLEEVLYKIAHEALNNIVKHAKAEHVTIHFLFSDRHCRMTIEDDGVGFDPVTAQGEGGLGLRGIAERVQQIGGHLLVESSPKQGAKLQVAVNTQAEKVMTPLLNELGL